MVHDVNYVAVRCSDEEPAHTPWLCSYRVHDLVAEFLRFFIGTFDVIRVDQMTESSDAVASRVTSCTFALVSGEV